MEKGTEEMTARFTILSPPRTKKTSNRIVTIKGKEGGRGFSKILPSAAHAAWFKIAMSQALLIRQAVKAVGYTLPIFSPVHINAQFYLERSAGDLLGFEQALADFLQEPIASGKDPRRLIQNGCGVINNDVQIISWDGSRLRKDAKNPRIEVEIQALEIGQGDLFG